MSDPRAMLRVVDELLWTLRREGLVVSTAQAIEATRAAALVGFDDRERLMDALAATIVTRASDRARFERAFASYFGAEPRRDLFERLAAQGFSEGELGALRSAFASWVEAGTSADATALALFARGSELEQVLRMAGVVRAAHSLASEMQLGFVTHRALRAAELPRARTRLSALRTGLVDALGARGDALADALARELDEAESDVRSHFARALVRRDEERRPVRATREATAFTALDPTEIEDVRRAVRRFAERLRGGASVRKRRARRGAVDPARTLRAAMRTGGVPLRLLHRARTRDKPRLVLLCDISDSVRVAAGFMLELVAAMHDLFDRTRSFVFVSDVAETTALFEALTPAAALAEAYAGTSAHAASNSNYGRALRNFEARFADQLDSRTTVVVLGDGRTNFQDDGEATLRRIRDKVRALYWFCPEAQSGWGTGDSAMLRYAPHCTRVLETRTARDLEEGARLLVRSRG